MVVRMDAHRGSVPSDQPLDDPLWQHSTAVAARPGLSLLLVKTAGSLRTRQVAQGRGDAGDLPPAGDALLGEVLQHLLGRAVLVGGGRHHGGAHRQPGHVDRHARLAPLVRP